MTQHQPINAAAAPARPKHPKRSAQAPTAIQYSNLQLAYDYFNETLFDNELTPCMITLHGRNQRCMGYFHAEQWQGKDETACHEIALTPFHLDRPLKDVFGTLVHEMAHLWQQDHGKPSRNGYHNKEWGAKMKDVGLYPSNTGKEGGKETGQQMTHYVIPGGAFDVAFRDMPDEIRLPWVGVAPGEKEKKSPKKTKYECPCGQKVWGKPELSVRCEECEELFEEVG